MLKQAQPAAIQLSTPKPWIGSLGHLSIFLWALVMVLVPSLAKGIISALFALGILLLIYPAAVKRLARPRWLVIFGILFLVNLFFGVSDQVPDLSILGFSFSSLNILSSIQMTLRAAVILLAADGLSSSVNIVEVAGLLERSGMRGLGFSIGVATNLLPDLRQSGMNAWHSLRMRGGFHAECWRGMQLLVVTVFSNALRHAEQIILAAEVRAFQPELSRNVPLRIGAMDWWLVAGSFILGIVSIFG
ncbi:MAG: energy-coupling factor transporter transmembrane protein EcfT [Anaerolineae bacterium]|nr:energy-coupling factor transporter transmembrane protein EcfT [Anaerolineae bacterium]